jgi:hypothetical protein
VYSPAVTFVRSSSVPTIIPEVSVQTKLGLPLAPVIDKSIAPSDSPGISSVTTYEASIPLQSTALSSIKMFSK